MRGASREAISDLIADPRYLLHRIDPHAGQAVFVPTTQAHLRKASFLDGRTDFSVGPAVTVALDALLQQDPPDTTGANRMIFHVAFCGSTLLARLLDLPGIAHVLKEPDVLVGLSEWQRRGADARFGPALTLALACLRRRWTADEVVIVKPTNWINNLIGDMARDPAGLKPVFITMDRRAYAIAVLRGGRERLAFAARTAAHLAPACSQGEPWLRAAVAEDADPMGRAVRLALTALHMQVQLFTATADNSLDFAEIVSQPAPAAQRASAILGLDISPARIAAETAARAASNAKAPDRAFSATERAGEDADVWHHHGATIDAALHWAERILT